MNSATNNHKDLFIGQFENIPKLVTNKTNGMNLVLSSNKCSTNYFIWTSYNKQLLEMSKKNT
jgi:hypothetical protein